MINRRALLGSAIGFGLAAPAILSRPARAAEFTMRWGHSMPASHPLTLRGLEAADAIRKESNGRIDIQLFPDNQLGGDNDMTAQIRAGALELYTPANTSIAPLVPLAGIVNTAFAFPDSASGWKALDGDLGKVIIAAFAKVNLHVFDKMWANGFRQITSANKPINAPADVVGFKIRVPTSPMLLSLFKGLGAAPVSMNVSELYTALQTKVVEGQENPLSIIATRNFNEVQKYCAMTNHVWDSFIQVGNRDFFMSMPESLRAIVARNLDAAAVRQREDIDRNNASLRATLEGKGMVFNVPDPAPFREALRKAGFYAQWKGNYGEEAWSVLERYTGRLS